MRKFSLFLTGCLSCILSFGQQTANPFPKTITVTGSAEMEIIPDEIYVQVVLREYQKRGEDKKELEGLKSDFIAAYKAAGIADSAVSIVSYTGYNNYYWLRKKKKSPDLYAGITYQVKFSNSRDMDALVDRLDDEATQAFTIVSTSHSKMTEFRKQLKIQAVKAAKEKAVYLTDAIQEKIAGAITVREPAENGGNALQARVAGVNYSNTISFSKVEGVKSLELDFKTIRYRYEVEVIFALQ